MEEFEINANDQDNVRKFRLKSAGNQWYEIYDQTGSLAGEIKIDQENHEHCETKGCTLDLPILDSIRKSIFLHKVFSED
ncbi:hypothetical protein [Pedobacter sp. JY14-1]|uniref:hypothetical protein n=1 Tax=Pedobacter sp. JY14-1 TaxID=3034151 RepID=UPI0023E2EB9A|nr:hypothetical protein [Pedobacter sp. JY14-1]